MAEILNLPQIRSKIGRTHARLTRLRLFEAFAIPAGILAAGLVLVISGAFFSLSGSVQAILWFAFIALFGVALVRGFFRYRAVTREEARERLDEAHPERPISGLMDRPAVLLPETRKYWDRHRSRLLKSIKTLRTPFLTREWKRTDPLYLRVILPVLLFGVIALNADQAVTRLKAASDTDLGALFGADEMEITAWVTPPDHTGEAPVFLSDDVSDVDVPTGSILTVRVHGPGTPRLKRRALTDQKIAGRKSQALSKLEDGAFQIELPVSVPQTVMVTYWGERASWTLNTEPDQPPEIRFDEAPGPGEDDQLVFTWSAEDDYGLASVSLKLQPGLDSGLPEDQTDNVAIDLAVPLIRSVDEAAELDMTRHKWAGLPVRMTLIATDAAGQSGASEIVEMTLPEKLFLEPLAKSSQEIRLEVLRDPEDYLEGPTTPEQWEQERQGLGDRLARAPDGVQRASLMLEAVTYKPEFFFEDMTVYFGLRRANELLRFANEKSDVEPIDDLLWSVALRAEYGTVADAARRLNAARRALESALRDGASEDEIRRLMEAFRNAAEDYIAARMAEAMMNGGEGGEPPPGMDSPSDTLGGTDLADMLDALEDLTETGATDAARQLLSDVTSLLNNLQFQQGGEGSSGMFGETGEQSEEDAPEGEQRLQRALDRLAELMEEQRRLNDETLQERFGTGEQQGGENEGSSSQQNGQQPGQFGQNMPGQNMPGGQNRPGMNQPGEPGSGEGEAEQFAPGGQSLADRQRILRDQLEMYLEENGEESGNGTAQSEERLDEARRALRRAESALRRGDLDSAQFNQDLAIREMRDAAGSLAENLDELRQARRGENGENAVSDPLGRQASGGQQNDGEGIIVPDQVERQRARDILDALRERLNNSSDPEEREYLERLLDRF